MAIPMLRHDGARLLTSSVGMLVFVGSWSMMFAALFFSYAMLRVHTGRWPPGGVVLPLSLPTLNTALLLLSALTMHRCSRAARPGLYARVVPYLCATIVLGTLFLVLQVATWIPLWEAGFTMRSGLHGGVFYLLTFFHGAHVLVGIVWLVSVLPGALHPGILARRVVRLRMAGIFWHFIDAIWVFIFLGVYVF